MRRKCGWHVRIGEHIRSESTNSRTVRSGNSHINCQVNRTAEIVRDQRTLFDPKCVKQFLDCPGLPLHVVVADRWLGLAESAEIRDDDPILLLHPGGYSFPSER